MSRFVPTALIVGTFIATTLVAVAPWNWH